MSIENPMSKPRTPEECYVYRKLCVPKPYTTPTEPERSTAIDMLFLMKFKNLIGEHRFHSITVGAVS